MSKYRFNSGLG